MGTTEVRGNCTAALLDYVDQTYDAERRQKVLASIPRDVVAAMQQANEKSWHPAAHFSQGLKAIADASASLEEARTEVVNVGTHIANASIESFMRLIMKMMTPKLLAHKLPDFFAKDFRNTEARLVADASRAKQGEMKVMSRNMQDLPYVSCAAVGWLKAGLAGIGCKGLMVEGPSEDWTLPDDEFVIRWQL